MTYQRSLLSAWTAAKASLLGYLQHLGSGKTEEAATEELAGYWHAYGGLRALARSPALWFSIAFTFICIPAWNDGKWMDATLSIVPSLTGFSLGAMAIVLAFPSSPLFKLFSEKGRADSYYLDLASRFVHFIFVQVFALLLAMLGRAYSSSLFVGFCGFFSLIYAISSAAFAALSLFGVAQIHNHPKAQKYLEPKGDGKDPTSH